MQERNDRLRVARLSEPLPQTETHNRTGRHGQAQVVEGAGQALHGPGQARIPGIGGKVYEEIRVPRPDDFTRIGPPTPNGIGFAARAERQRHTGHPGGSLPQRQNHVLLEYRVLSEGTVPVREEVDAVYRGGIQQVTAKPLEIGAVAEAPRNDRDDDTARPDRADRESEECRVEIRGRDPQPVEASSQVGPGIQLLVGRVQYGRVESSGLRKQVAELGPRTPFDEILLPQLDVAGHPACLARPADGPRAPLQERPERGIEFERGDRERTDDSRPWARMRAANAANSVPAPAPGSNTLTDRPFVSHIAAMRRATHIGVKYWPRAIWRSVTREDLAARRITAASARRRSAISGGDWGVGGWEGSVVGGGRCSRLMGLRDGIGRAPGSWGEGRIRQWGRRCRQAWVAIWWMAKG